MPFVQKENKNIFVNNLENNYQHDHEFHFIPSVFNRFNFLLIFWIRKLELRLINSTIVKLQSQLSSILMNKQLQEPRYKMVSFDKSFRIIKLKNYTTLCMLLWKLWMKNDEISCLWLAINCLWMQNLLFTFWSRFQNYANGFGYYNQLGSVTYCPRVWGEEK